MPALTLIKEREAAKRVGSCPMNAKLSPIELDARGLEPPQPMLRILEALSQLAADTELLARTDRQPMFLYDQLTRRGFVGTSEAQTDGSFLTRIRRMDPDAGTSANVAAS